MSRSMLCVIGGGIIGLGLAGALMDQYEEVLLVEKNNYCYREASYASGGMLAPFMEVEFGEEEVLSLSKRSLSRYDSFVHRLRTETGMPLTLQSRGSLYVAVDEVQRTDIERLHDYQTKLGLPVERLSAAEAKDRESLLSDNVLAGLYVSREKHINSRQLGVALYKRCCQNEVGFVMGQPVEGLDYDPGERSIRTVRTSRQKFHPDAVILSAGSWTGRLPGLKPQDRMPVRPVKGQAVSVQPGKEFNPRTVIRSPDFYGVPHGSERFLIGATMEEKGYDHDPTAGHVMELLESASLALPGLRGRPFQEFWTGLRPATPDNRPIIGRSAVTENLYFATGHFRNGILQLPITVDALKHELTEGQPLDGMEPFDPSRFQKTES